MKKQKKDKRRQSTQQLMGVKKITDYCISTDAGDLVFYIIKPTNISVLPAGAVSAKIRALQNTLSAQAGVELLAMNSRESFNATCLFYHDRMHIIVCEEPVQVGHIFLIKLIHKGNNICLGSRILTQKRR